MIWQSSNVSPGEDVLAEQYNDLRADVATVKDSAVLVGTVVMWAGTELNLDENWKVCDGSAISRTTYSDLYAIQGNTFGAGDGSTTFNIPDMRDRFVVGAGSSYSQNAKGGSNTVNTSHSHTVNSHSHSISQHSHTVASHTHTIPNHAHDSGSYVAAIYLTTDGIYWNRSEIDCSTNLKNALWGSNSSWVGGHPYSTDVQGLSGYWAGTSGASAPGTSVGGVTGTGASAPGTTSSGSSSLENRPPYIGIFYIIKVL